MRSNNLRLPLPGRKGGYQNLETSESWLSLPYDRPRGQQQQYYNPQPHRNPPRHPVDPYSYGTGPAGYGGRDMNSTDAVSASNAAGVATGAVGRGYGPYSYEQTSARPTLNPFRDTSERTASNVQGSSKFKSPPAFQDRSVIHTKPHAASSAPKENPTQGDTPTLPVVVGGPTWTRRDAEIDEELHNPAYKNRDGCNVFSVRGWLNGTAIFLIMLGLVFLFAGYPTYNYFYRIKSQERMNMIGAYGVGGINASGQVPSISDNTRRWGLIDKDTPKSALTRTGFDGKDYTLVFSDEFNEDGRTFWPGDDPYWEAMDFHYWVTDDWEWYDPDAITTRNGSLVITFTQEPIHNMNFRSGMLQSWNKFCFTGGYIEVAVRLPGASNVPGYWPGAWTLGNLGRPGYAATTEGLWPYSYDACDVGILEYQLYSNQTGPAGALNGLWAGDPRLSGLPGMRLPSCTCASEDHPGPNHGVARASPEIDIIEAEVSRLIPGNANSPWIGKVSQSAQFAPYDDLYLYGNQTGQVTIYNETATHLNGYRGGPLQEAVSGLTLIRRETYQVDQRQAGVTAPNFGTYGFEYAPGANGHVTWVVDNKATWRLDHSAVGPNPRTEISQRPMSQEPMSIVLNLGMSDGFSQVNLADLEFPGEYLIDYVRVYQTSNNINVGCDPDDYPTSDYIQRHLDIYMNPNITSYRNAGYPWPKNRLTGC